MPAAHPLPEVVYLTCPRCGRSGRYRRERYVALAGTEDAPSALLEFARAAGCPVAIKQHAWEWSDRCRIVYDLEARRAAEAGRTQATPRPRRWS